MLLLTAAFALKGLFLPAVGFGDLWFDTEVARGAGSHSWNVYEAVEKQLATRYRHPEPAGAAPYGPAYYMPLYAFHAPQRALGIEHATTCDAVCELSKRPLFWGLEAKLPHLLVDAACVLLLLSLRPSRTGRRAAVLFAVSPGLFYVTYVMGQMDIFPIVTIVAAFVLLARGNPPREGPQTGMVDGGAGTWWWRHADVLAMVALGVGGAMKVVPLFFGLGFAMAIRRNLWRALGLFAISIGTTAIIGLPFIGSAYFVKSYYSSSRAISLLAPDAFGFNLLTLTVLATILVARWAAARRGRLEALLVTMVGMGAAIAFFHDFNPQRGLYLVASVAIAAAYVPLSTLALLAANAVVLLHPIISAGVGSGSLAPLDPVFAQLPAPVQFLGPADYTTALRLATRSAGIVTAVLVIGMIVAQVRTTKPPLRWGLWQPAVMLVACGVVVGILLSPLMLGRLGAEAESGTAPTGDVTGRLVRQPFVTQYGKLTRIDVYIDPFNGSVPRFVDLRVLDGCDDKAAVIRQVRGDLWALFSGQPGYVPFSFGALDAPAGVPLCFELDFTSFQDGRPVGLLLARKPGAGAAILGASAAAQPVVFQDRYQVPLGGVVSDVARHVGREWPVALAAPIMGLLVGLGMAEFAGRRENLRSGLPTCPAGVRPR